MFVITLTDHSSGFGGKFGVQSDRQDSSALGYDHQEKVEKHASQKDYSSGFGGKYGVSDRKDEVSSKQVLLTLCEGSNE